jgi:hypothetical protein
VNPLAIIGRSSLDIVVMFGGVDAAILSPRQHGGECFSCSRGIHPAMAESARFTTPDTAF